MDNPLSLNRYTYTHNNPLRFVDPSGHVVEEGTGGIGGFTSQKAEYMHWAGVAARKAYEQGIEPEDAVRMYVPTYLQEEVLSTAVVTFNTAVWVNHGDAPDLGLAAPTAGMAAASIKNNSKSTSTGTSKALTQETGNAALAPKKGGGKGKNNMQYDPNAVGEHSTYKSDPQTGEIINWQRWFKSDPRNPNPYSPGERFDSTGDPHFNKKKIMGNSW